MTTHEIALLRNFSKSEKDVFGREIFEKYYEIENDLMTNVDNLVDFAKQNYGTRDGALIVHDINLGEHVAGSLHGKGRAIDGHFKGINLFQITVLLMKFGFNGIGLYPQWNAKGFHADIRKGPHTSTWVYYDEEYNYDWLFFEEQLEIELEC